MNAAKIIFWIVDFLEKVNISVNKDLLVHAGLEVQFQVMGVVAGGFSYKASLLLEAAVKA